jgi:hypothetical protein
VVLTLTLAAVLWYTWETMKLRRIASEQLEGMSKPCLTLWADLRDPRAAIMGSDDAVGGTVASGDDANFVVQNIGTGVALNVRYRFILVASSGGTPDYETRYFLSVLQGQKVRMPEPMNASTYSGKCDVVFTFDSIGGRTYESRVGMTHHVLTKSAFRQTPQRP